MSAIRTTNGEPTHVNGFNEHTYYDPFFPSSPSEEQLVPTSLSPDPHSHHSPSPSLSTTPAHSTTPPHTYNPTHHASHSPYMTNDFQQADSAPQTLDDQFNYTLTDDFLTPSVYLSDNGYNGSDEHTGSPELNDGFYLANDIDLVTDPAFHVHGVGPQDYVNNGADTAIPERKISDDSNKNRTTSLGTATLSSHLMSPALTERASPELRDEHDSPTVEQDTMKVEAINNSRLSSGDYTDAMTAHMQHTPALTGSSQHTSPDRNTRPDIARAASPVFRIESYSRGDSPARAQGLMVRAGSKRGHASSHLAVEQADSSEDCEGEDVEDDYFQPQPSSTGEHERGRSFDAADRPGLDPVARLQISTENVPNFKDQEDSAQTAMKNADVEEWLAKSEASSEVGGEESFPPRPKKAPTFSKRQRAKSAGDSLSRANLESLRRAGAPPADLHIPGPGLLLDEDSEEEQAEWSDNEEGGSDLPDSPPATLAELDKHVPATTTTIDKTTGNTEPPLLYRAKLWQDPIYDSSDPGPGVQMQPTTSNEAMHKYEQRSREFDNLSRAATWGTRRLSESDLVGVFHRLSFGSKDDDGVKEKQDRRGTFLEQAAAKLRPKRSGSFLKRKDNDSPLPVSRPAILEHVKKDSSSSLGLPGAGSVKRMPSLGKKPKSPRIDTGSAVAGIASIAALGAGANGSTSATATSTPSTPWAAVRSTIMRTRRGSDVHAPSPTSNLGDLWKGQGGPPMPTLAAPTKEDPKPLRQDHSEGVEDDEDEAMEEKGITIDFTIRTDPIIPTQDGFRSHVKQLNPRLPPYMVDRIAREQLSRYKKLMEFKIKHAQAINNKKCSSGKHCTSLGGEPRYFASKTSSKEPELSHTGFSVTGLGPSDDDTNALPDGIVTPAQFPPGVPMPPVDRLPAEFECSRCFKVKKFQKPSDWSKHVHEDVQPFTCTFANCVEPKSFKRKADWVRHENERHRQLEWWTCNIVDCSHKCYRKDNFVQHLVREHKLPEPKIKTLKPSKPAVRGPSAQKARKQMEEQSEEFPEEIDQVWRLVEECRHETPKNPTDEPCRFCGNVCNSWKKLTVHLAKHMEQISMPVLNLVDQMAVTPDTVISPIERSSQQPSMSPSVLSSLPPSQPAGRDPYGIPPSTFSNQYIQIQSPGGYYSGVNQNSDTTNFQRHGPATYPPQMPSTGSSPGFPPNRPNVNQYGISNFASYDTPTTPSFMPVNDPHALTQSSSPDNLYAGNRAQAPLQSNPYGAGGPYQPPFQPQHQHYANGVKLEQTPQYGFPRTSPPMPNYNQQAPTTGPMHFHSSAAGDTTSMGYTQAPMNAAMYGQHPNLGYGYQ